MGQQRKWPLIALSTQPIGLFVEEPDQTSLGQVRACQTCSGAGRFTPRTAWQSAAPRQGRPKPEVRDATSGHRSRERELPNHAANAKERRNLEFTLLTRKETT